MATHWLRRAWLLAACASALLLGACGGGGEVVSQFSPSRVVAFGDGMADVGQTGARYTVNDGSLNNWTQAVASEYGLPLVASSAGGLSYAWINARITAKPGAGGDATAPTIKEQVDAFLASGAPTSDDLVILSAGTSDVISQVKATLDGTQSASQMEANMAQAGRDFAEQVKRLVAAGAKHVVVAGTYNLGRSPWARELNSDALLEPASSAFNQNLLVALVDYGSTVLYVDAALYFNQLTGSSNSNIANSTDIVCTTVDPSEGIGTGTGQINSRFCTQSTIAPNIDYSTYLFADRVYPTPRGHQLFGDYAAERIRDRW